MPRFQLLVSLSLSLSGCVSWSPTEIAAPEKIPANRQIMVWTGSRSIRLRAVQVTEDSLSGVPFSSAATCATCRISLSLNSVDSLQSQSSQALPVVLATAPFVFLIAAIMTYDGGSTD